MAKAKAAMSTAPEINTGLRYKLMPAVINPPNPPASMNVAKAPAPTSKTNEVRTPVIITGSASGNSTLNRTCMGDIDKPRAASTSELSTPRSEEHTSELQSRGHLVCRLLLEK